MVIYSKVILKALRELVSGPASTSVVMLLCCYGLQQTSSTSRKIARSTAVKVTGNPRCKEVVVLSHTTMSVMSLESVYWMKERQMLMLQSEQGLQHKKQ